MALTEKNITADLCVVGGGLAGINVAITAARLGVNVVLIQERPVFGGNASGEMRMWVCGLRDLTFRETGLSEEINLENFAYNPTKNYALWDSLLYGKVHAEKNLTPLLNCTCFDAKTQNGKITSVTAYQMTTQTIYNISADYFADCSGDSILAPLTGAEFMYGRESQAQYNEPMRSHTEQDNKTMGNSCLLQARKTNRKIPFRAPDWAEKVSVEKLKSKNLNLYSPFENFWYIEIGGITDVIGQAENLNKRLVALCLGIWDTVKNSGEFDADYFELEFMGFLGAKRESRRMTGDYVLTANDILNSTIFPDTVAYGGWPLDDHYPEGFDGKESNYAIVFNKPYGIPYRSLYSVNIDNLFFAGRNISATHMAMSSARVMGTCSTIGQAVGVAVAVAKKYGISPRKVNEHIDEVQQILLLNDCYLPEVPRKVSDICLNATLCGATDVLRNGIDRNFAEHENSVCVTNGEQITYQFKTPTHVSGAKIVFDSDLKRDSYDVNLSEKLHSMRCNILDDSPHMSVPVTLAKEYEITARYPDGTTQTIAHEKENLKRNVILNIEKPLSEVTLRVLSNWGNTDRTDIFTFELF